MSINEHQVVQSASIAANIDSTTTAPFPEDIKTPIAKPEESDEASSENQWDEDTEVPDEEILDEDEEVQDEEVPDESEEPLTTEYNIENTPGNGNAYVAAGDQAQLHHHTTYHHVTNRYDHLKIILESKQSATDEQADIFRDIRDLIKQALSQAPQHNVVPPPKDEEDTTKLPATHHAFSQWFYGLDEYEQCYAQAAAILHGTAASDVSRYADEFYLLHRRQQTADTSSRPEVLSEELQASLLSQHNRSRRDLQTKTFTITQRVDGVERLYWRDVQVDGSSSFHLQVLDFLAGEYQSKGLHGQKALKRLGKWAQINNAELFQCMAKALGVFLWHQSKDALRDQADEWAQKLSMIRWQRTSVLLNAAYEIDVIMSPEHENSYQASPTLSILAEWVGRAQKMGSKADVYRGCAAANTYALIGKRQRDIALSGLAQLLLVSIEDPVEIEKLQAAVVSAYFTLSWSGHIHQIFSQLATIAEQSLLQKGLPAPARSRRLYRLQCQLRLKASLDAFFFIALDALSSATDQCAANYQQPGSDSPSSQEKQQRDNILAGILATDETSPLCWRKQAVQMLSVAIIERSSHASALDLLFRWANVLLSLKDISSSQGQQLIIFFQLFLVDLGHMLQRMCLDLQRQNRPSPAFQLYKQRLALWSREQGARGHLFRQVVH